MGSENSPSEVFLLPWSRDIFERVLGSRGIAVPFPLSRDGFGKNCFPRHDFVVWHPALARKDERDPKISLYDPILHGVTAFFGQNVRFDVSWSLCFSDFTSFS